MKIGNLTKKIIIFAMTAVMTVIMSVTAFATSDDSSSSKRKFITATTSDGNTIILYEVPNSSSEQPNDELRGTSKPTIYHNLSNGDYYTDPTGSIFSPQYWNYTRRYFNCSSIGTLYVKYKVRSCASFQYENKLIINIFDLTTNQSYVGFLTDWLPGCTQSYLEDQMYFSGLTTGHNYAVGFKVWWEFEPYTADGWARVSHSYITGSVTE